MRKASILIILTGILSIILINIFVIKIFQKWGIVKDSGFEVIKPNRDITDIPNNDTPALYTEGNQIKRKNTGEAIILKGATSDEFRRAEGKYSNIDELYRRIKILKDAGGNLITFWVTNDGYDAQVELAGKVVDFADENGMYVLWGPAELYSPNWDDRRNVLMLKLAIKFKDKTNVMYGLDAEPFQKWDVVTAKAYKLGQQIRQINPDALLFLPGAEGGKKIELSGDINSPMINMIFGTEEYLANSLKDLKWLQSSKSYQEHYVWQNEDYKNYPVLVSEMGGVSTEGFSSPEDLEVIKRMLEDIAKRGFSFQMHSLDSYGITKTQYGTFDTRGLGMFDEKGEINEKGRLYFDFLSRYPDVKFK